MNELGDTRGRHWLWRVLCCGLLVIAGCGEAPTEPKPTGEVPANSAVPKEPEKPRPSMGASDSGWSSEWSHIGEVRVRLDRVAVEKPMVLSATGKPYQDQFEHLVVWVTVENLSQSELKFRRWEFGDGGLKVTDEQGRSYDSRSFSTVHPVGGIKGREVTIAPGESLKDVLLFKAPDTGSGTLKVMLPALAGDSTSDGSAIHEFRVPPTVWGN